MRRIQVLSTMAATVILGGCGNAPEPSWFPLNTGARWEYDVTTDTDGVVKRNTQTITVISNNQLKDQPVYTRRTQTSGNIGIEYLLQVSPTAITRIAQRTDLQELPVADASPRTVLQLPLQVGATWSTPTVAYAVMRRSEYPRELKYGKPLSMVYTVESVSETVEVPAGKFENCARVTGRADLTIYADPVSGFRKTPITTTEWYCKDVGLVKLERIETIDTSFFGGGRIDMALSSYSIR